MRISIFLVIICCASLTLCQDSNTRQELNLEKSIQHGADVYNNFCILCHLPDGNGIPNTFPPLANSDYLMNKRNESIKIVKYGMSGEITVNGKTYNNLMAPLGLSNQEVADVMNYITSSWGNKNNKIFTEDEVSKIRR